MLEIWLDLSANIANEKQPSAASGGYEIVLVRERKPRDPAKVRCAIRKWLRHCYAPLEYAEDRVVQGAYQSLEDVYQDEKFPSQANVRVRHGDFGEALGHFLLEAHPSFGLWLPVIRLRHKEDPEKSLFGFDLIGFYFAHANSNANLLCIGEVRLRTSKDNRVIADGHATLSSYTRAREIQQIGRIAHWLHSQGRAEDCSKLAMFSEAWGAEEFERRHVFVGLFDTALPLPEMVEAMNKIDGVLPTFSVCVVIIDGLRDRIEEGYKR